MWVETEAPGYYTEVYVVSFEGCDVLDSEIAYYDQPNSLVKVVVRYVPGCVRKLTLIRLSGIEPIVHPW